MTEKMNESVSKELFMMLAGILMVVLAAWAAIWGTTAQLFTQQSNMTSVGWGLCFVYEGILSLLAAIVITVGKKRLTGYAWALFWFSCLAIFYEVVVSLVSVVIKVSNGRPLWEPLTNLSLPFWGNIVIMLGVPAVILALLMWILNRGTVKKPKV
jgi:hypothetical protein